MLKSCRNCQHARHDGYFYVRLICRVNGQVVAPFSASLDGNKRFDASAQARALTCEHYVADSPARDWAVAPLAYRVPGLGRFSSSDK